MQRVAPTVGYIISGKIVLIKMIETFIFIALWF
jgi:hypothetical protein